MPFFDDDSIQQTQQIAIGAHFSPRQQVRWPTSLDAQIQQIKARLPVSLKPKNNVSPGGTSSLPQVFSVIATQAPLPGQNQTKSQVTVQITRNPNDLNFGSLNVWFKNYHGNSSPQLMASSSSLPVIFNCDVTGENVVVIAQIVGQDGIAADVNSSPTTTLKLNGVTTAPPPPSIAQSLVGTPTGYQFSFNQLPTQLADTIDGYNIYRNTTGVLDGSQTKIQYVKQNPQAVGAIVITDTIVAAIGAFYFYWVSAVDTQGLESALTAAQSSAVQGSVGSIPPSQAPTILNGFTWTVTTTEVDFSWLSSPIFRADGTITNTLPKGTLAVTGLLSGYQYRAYPYWSESLQQMKWVGTDLVFPNITSVSFDGSTGYVQTGTTSVLSAYTVECWAKIPSGNTANHGLMQFSLPQGTGAVSGMALSLWISNGVVGGNSWNGSGTPKITASGSNYFNVNDGAWHHIVFTLTSGGIGNLYVDNKNVATRTDMGAPGSPATLNWHLGVNLSSAAFATGPEAMPFSTNAFLNGNLSHCAVYNTALTANQIANHFITGVNIGFGGSNSYDNIVSGDGPAFYWKLTETNGTTAADSAGTNTGTYTGGFTLNQVSAIVVPIGTSSAGAIMFPYTTFLATQAQSLRDRIPLATGSLNPTTTTSGTGSGGGGGGGTGGTPTDRGGCLSPNTKVKTQRGDIRFDELKIGDYVLTAKGTWRPISRILVHEWNSHMLDMGEGELITRWHHLQDSHNWVPSADIFPTQVEYSGTVYDLCVDSEEPIEFGLCVDTERSYTLANGRIAHNTFVLPK